MQQANPILVEVTRGPFVESVHRGAAVVVDNTGRVVASWGDANATIYPRSAVKPLQAFALVRSGAAQALEVDAREIALACASHAGEPVHTAAVEQWLHRIGLGPAHLECGAHPPTDPATHHELIHSGRMPTPLHNNCSGKHAGFLTLCQHLGLPAQGYIHADHPVQQLVRDTLSEFTGHTLAEAVRGIDGCGIPVYGIPLRGLATAMTKFSQATGLDDDTANALKTIRESIITHPYMASGRNGFCTEIMDALAPNVLVKTGAEGTCCAAVLDQGLGIALKIDDGAGRAVEVAISGIFQGLGALVPAKIGEAGRAQLQAKLEPEVHNAAGLTVGVIRVAESLSRPN